MKIRVNLWHGMYWRRQNLLIFLWEVAKSVLFVCIFLSIYLGALADNTTFLAQILFSQKKFKVQTPCHSEPK